MKLIPSVFIKDLILYLVRLAVSLLFLSILFSLLDNFLGYIKVFEVDLSVVLCSELRELVDIL